MAAPSDPNTFRQDGSGFNPTHIASGQDHVPPVDPTFPEEATRLLELMGESYFETDLSGKLTRFNDYVCRFHGRDREELERTDFRSFMPPEIAEKVYRIYREVLSSGRPSTLFEYDIIRKNGQIASVESVVFLRKDPDGKTVGFMGISRDITDKKRIEGALRQSEEKHRLILANMAEGYYEVDLKGTFTFANQACCRTLGLTYEEVIGMNYRDCMPPHAASEAYRVYNEVFRTGVPEMIFQCELIRKDGSTRIHEMSVSPLRRPSGDIIGFSGICRDLTERLQMEKALRESEESYRRVVELAPDAITISNIENGEYFEVNEVFCQQTGYRREEVIGKTISDLDLFENPDDRRRLTDALHQNGCVSGMEITYRARNGAILFYLLSARTIQFKGERCMMVVAALINELKAAQQASLENETRYRTILDAAPDSICLSRLSDGKYIEVNPAFYRLTGYSPEETIERTSCDLNIYVDPEDRKRFIEILERQGYVNGFEIRVRYRDGRISVNLWGGRIVRYKGEDCLLVVAKEIDELKLAQKALEERENDYRRITETAPYSITLTRMSDGKQVQVNEAFCRRTGYRKEEVIGRTVRELGLFEDENERLRYMETIRREGRVDAMEFRFRSKDGRISHMLVSARHIQYKGEACLLAVTVDIGPLKKAEQELDQYRRHLEEMVNSRTRELEAAQKELIKREKLSVLGQLTATVSHELRNPLGVIRSSNFYLQRRVKDKDEKIDKHFRRIEEQVALCDAIVADLLEFTRGRNVSIATEYLGPWLEELVVQLQEGEGIPVELHLDERLPPVPHDREKLRRAVLNVLDNAIQAVRERQRSCEASGIDYAPVVTLKTQLIEKDAIIVITDNGIGMSRETVERAFEPLFTTRARGTGIGLANVKKIVEEHAGDIGLESSPGRGTRVTIRLPC